MATVFRDPTIMRAAKRDNLGARQLVAVGLALLTAVSLPVGSTVGRDKPAPKKPYVDKSWPRQRNLPLQLTTLLPRGKSAGFDLPRKRKLDLPDTINSESLSLSAQPFGQFGWELPDRVRHGQLDAAFVNLVPIETPVIVVLPFAQNDWSVIARVKLGPPDTAFVNLLPLQPVVAPPVSHGYIKWTKPHRKRDAHAEILAIVRQVAAGPQIPETAPLEPVVVETIAQQVAEQIRPTIDTDALVTQITAAIVAHYAQMDEEDTETLLTGLL